MELGVAYRVQCLLLWAGAAQNAVGRAFRAGSAAFFAAVLLPAELRERRVAAALARAGDTCDAAAAAPAADAEPRPSPRAAAGPAAGWAPISRALGLRKDSYAAWAALAALLLIGSLYPVFATLALVFGYAVLLPAELQDSGSDEEGQEEAPGGRDLLVSHAPGPLVAPVTAPRAAPPPPWLARAPSAARPPAPRSPTPRAAGAAPARRPEAAAAAARRAPSPAAAAPLHLRAPGAAKQPRAQAARPLMRQPAGPTPGAPPAAPPLPVRKQPPPPQPPQDPQQQNPRSSPPQTRPSAQQAPNPQPTQRLGPATQQHDAPPSAHPDGQPGDAAQPPQPPQVLAAAKPGPEPLAVASTGDGSSGSSGSSDGSGAKGKTRAPSLQAASPSPVWGSGRRAAGAAASPEPRTRPAAGLQRPKPCPAAGALRAQSPVAGAGSSPQGSGSKVGPALGAGGLPGGARARRPLGARPEAGQEIDAWLRSQRYWSSPKRPAAARPQDALGAAPRDAAGCEAERLQQQLEGGGAQPEAPPGAAPGRNAARALAAEEQAAPGSAGCPTSEPAAAEPVDCGAERWGSGGLPWEMCSPPFPEQPLAPQHEQQQAAPESPPAAAAQEAALGAVAGAAPAALAPPPRSREGAAPGGGSRPRRCEAGGRGCAPLLESRRRESVLLAAAVSFAKASSHAPGFDELRRCVECEAAAAVNASPRMHSNTRAGASRVHCPCGTPPRCQCRHYKCEHVARPQTRIPPLTASPPYLHSCPEAPAGELAGPENASPWQVDPSDADDFSLPLPPRPLRSAPASARGCFDVSCRPVGAAQLGELRALSAGVIMGGAPAASGGARAAAGDAGAGSNSRGGGTTGHSVSPQGGGCAAGGAKAWDGEILKKISEEFAVTKHGRTRQIIFIAANEATPAGPGSCRGSSGLIPAESSSVGASAPLGGSSSRSSAASSGGGGGGGTPFAAARRSPAPRRGPSPPATPRAVPGAAGPPHASAGAHSPRASNPPAPRPGRDTPPALHCAGSAGTAAAVARAAAQPPLLPHGARGSCSDGGPQISTAARARLRQPSDALRGALPAAGEEPPLPLPAESPLARLLRDRGAHGRPKALARLNALLPAPEAEAAGAAATPPCGPRGGFGA